MDSRLGPGGLTALIGALAIGLAAGTRVTGNGSATNTPLPGADARSGGDRVPSVGNEQFGAASLDRPLDEVRDFFGCERRSAPRGTKVDPLSSSDPCSINRMNPPSVKSLADEVRALAESHGYQPPRFVIAMVPDPLDSYVGGEFDTYVTALLRGANASRWRLDRHWFPWAGSASPATGGDARKSDGTDSDERSSLHQNSPGIVLFRRDGEAERRTERELLTVFLIGESPLTGIHKRPFVDCLRLASEILHSVRVSNEPSSSVAREVDATPPEERGSIQVLGPFSSGAANSVAVALENWCRGLQTPPSVHFLSGSATGPDLPERLRAPTRLCPSLTVGFRSTVVSDRLLQKAAFEFFERKLEWHSREIALLAESDTSYGGAVQDRESDGIRDQESDGLQDRGDRPWHLFLPVPSALASVRTAWERTRPPTEVKIGEVKLPAYALELKLEETRTVKDIFPDFRPMTAPLNELKLQELLSTLAREKIRHLGLLFTDVRDKLFLAEQIRKYAPHVSIFTFEASVLYFHPRINPYTDGVLVISSYPLSTLTQQLMGGFGDENWRQVFGSDSEQGFYNATVIALTDPVDKPRVTGYLTIRGTLLRAPAVWISAVGDGRMVPLDVVRPFDAKNLPTDPRQTSRGLAATAADDHEKPSGLPPESENLIRRLRVPSSFRFLFWIATLGFALTCVAFGLGHSKYGERLKRWPTAFFRPLERPGSPEKMPEPVGPLRWRPPSDERQKHAWTLALIVALSAIWIALGTVYVIPFVARRNFDLAVPLPSDPHIGSKLPWFEETILRPLVSALPLIGLLLVGALAYLGWILASTFRTRWRLVLPALAGLATVALLLVSSRSLIAFSRGNVNGLEHHIFTYLRASSGPANLSPLAGLLLLISGSAVLTVFQLQRLRIRDGWRCSDPPSGKVIEEEVVSLHNQSLRSMGKLRTSLGRRVLEPFPKPQWYFVVLLAILLPLLVTFFLLFEAAADSWIWSKGFAGIFTILLLASLAAFSRFVSLWWGLRGIINRLESSDLVNAFERNKEELEWHALRGWGKSKRHSYSILIRSVEALTRLSDRKDLPEGIPGDAGSREVFDERAKAAQKSLRDTLDAHSERNVLDERKSRVELLNTLDRAAIHAQYMINHIDRTSSDLLDPALRLELTDYLALQAFLYIRYVFAEIRNSLLASTLGLLFLLAGLASFQFQPIRSVYVLLWSVIGFVAIWIVAIFVQMDRNTLMSKLSGTTPGQVNPVKSGFLFQVATFVLPLVLALMLTQFPRFGQTLVGWTTPLVRLFQ